MGELTRGQLARLLADRQGTARAAEFSPEAVCFDRQVAVLRSSHRRKALRCGRRSGKTRTIAVGLHDLIRTPPFTNVFYITLTQKNAKRIIWAELKRLNTVYNLGGVPHEQDASLRFPALGHDVHIYTGGAKDAAEVEKWRGVPGKAWILDEFQSFPQRIIKPLMREAIQPAAMDHQGEIWAAGTCPPLRSGYFWDIDSGELKDQWEHHRWTVRENTLLPARVRGVPIEEILAEVLKENRWDEDHPTFQREYLNEWVTDENALVFRWRPANDFDILPGGRWSYVIGIDLGFEDADAIAVLGWTANDPTVYLVEEVVQRKAGVTELAERVRDLHAKYKPVKLVADFGGLGKKIAEEIRRRYSLPVEAADKQRKLEHIELLNDAMRGLRFRARAGGCFAEDAALVQWDQDARAKGVQKIAEDYHSDITDAVLYAFRACYGYLSRPEPAKPVDPNAAHIQRLVQAQAAAQQADQMASLLGFED